MIREFFYLQKSDRKTVLTLLIAIVVGFGVIFLTGGEQEEAQGSPKDSQHHPTTSRNVSYYVAPKKVERFYFDPNTADSTQLLRLGLQLGKCVTFINTELQGASTVSLRTLLACMA